ncbi:MAG: hypothetical protein U1E60_28955 [Reyranellaceae bacterium]
MMARLASLPLPRARLAYVIAGLALAGLAAYSYLKGATEQINFYAIVYHVVNYGDGLIRRGLPGEMLSWFVDQKDIAAVRAAVNISYVVLQAGLAVALFAWVIVIDMRRRDYLLFGLFAVFLASQFVPTLAGDNGYLDVYAYILLVAAAVGFARRWPVMVILAGLVGPFIHESFLFCWLTLCVVVLWQGVSPVRLLLLCVPLISTTAIELSITSGPITSQLMASALTPENKAHGLRWVFGQNAALNLDLMIVKLRHYAVNVAIAFAFYTLPAAISIGVYGVARRRWSDAFVLAAATLAPLVILLLAWDLSRFLAGANFFALLAILYMETVRPAPRTSWRSPVLCAAIALILIQVPFIYAYFEIATVSDRGPVDMRTWPLGRIAVTGTQYFNRYVGPRFIAQVGHESPPGDAWYVEENGWRGTWIRRPGTNVFDAGMAMGGDVVPYTATVERSGNTIIVRRQYGTDESTRMDYIGTLDGDVIRGTSPGGRWIALVRHL